MEGELRERSCKDGPNRQRSQNPHRPGSRRLRPYKQAVGLDRRGEIGRSESVEYETRTEGDGRILEVADSVVAVAAAAAVVVDFCEGGGSGNPCQYRAHYRHRHRDQRGWGRLEVGIGSEDRGTGAAEVIPSCRELDLGSLD